MKDEYGTLDANGEVYIAERPFVLECGEELKDAQVCYRSYGTLNEQKDNVIVVCHALTGNATLSEWWGPMLGTGLTFDTSKYFVICANILGSCYGSTGPTSINPTTGVRYGVSFPKVTIRDTVRMHIRLIKEHLGIRQVRSVVGGSMGGMQALEWALLGGPSFIRSVVPIGCGAAHTAWQIGISETQRLAIYNDPKWNGGDVDPADPPVTGLSLARQIAMISYRTSVSFHMKFGRAQDENGRFEVHNYLSYQGEKFIDRFDAMSFVSITNQMDTHDVGRGRGGIEAALRSLKNDICIIGIDSDILYPPREQKEMAQFIPQSELHMLSTADGHDGFILQVKQLDSIIQPFLAKLTSK